MQNHSNEEMLTTIFMFNSICVGTVNNSLDKITYGNPQSGISTCQHRTEPVPHWEFSIMGESFIVDIKDVYQSFNKITGNEDSRIFEGIVRGNGNIPMTITVNFIGNQHILIGNLETLQVMKLSDD